MPGRSYSEPPRFGSVRWVRGDDLRERGRVGEVCFLVDYVLCSLLTCEEERDVKRHPERYEFAENVFGVLEALRPVSADGGDA